EEPRRRVLEVAGDLFAERGFDDVTMADIAQSANVARATVFNYFGSKHALIEEITEPVIDFYRAMLDEALPDDRSPTPILRRRVFEEMGRGIESQRRFCRGVFREIARVQLGLDESSVSQTANEAAKTRLIQLFERGQARGDMSEAFSPTTLAQAFYSLTN